MNENHLRITYGDTVLFDGAVDSVEATVSRSSVTLTAEPVPDAEQPLVYPDGAALDALIRTIA